MTKSTDALDSVFGALSDPTRRKILAQLMAEEKSLSELAAPFDISLTAVSKHVRVLTDSGLVNVEKRGRTRYCTLNASRIETASRWFDEYQALWLQSFDNLGRYLAEDRLAEDRPEPKAKRARKKRRKSR